MTNEELHARLMHAIEASNRGNGEEVERITMEILLYRDSPLPDNEGRLRMMLCVDALLLRAYTASSRGNYDAALTDTQMALSLAELHSLHNFIPKCWNSFGNVYALRSDYQRALECYHKALVSFEELGNEEGVARILCDIGAVYLYLSDYPQTLEYFSKALAAYEHLGNQTGAAAVTSNIGDVYACLLDYPRALEYYGKALATHEALGQHTRAASVIGNIGNVYFNLQDYPCALEYYSKALALYEEFGQKAEAATITGNIGSVYVFSDVARALEYYGKALANHEEIGNKSGAALIIGNIGEVYSSKELGVYDPAMAEEYLLKAIAQCAELGTKRQLYAFHKALADLYKMEKRWEECHAHFEKFYELEKEVHSTEAKKQAEKIETERVLTIERTRATAERNILSNILPEEITQRLIKGENPIADHFDSVSVLFMDIVGFTPLASTITAQQLVHLLNAVFSAADGVMREYGMEKIKTIGDAYMAVAGAPTPCDDHAHRAANAALQLLNTMQNLVVTFPDSYGDTSWIEAIPTIQVRIGLHCGSAAAGVVGENKFLYDLWGDAVNTASRMESHGEPGKIHVSEDFKHAVETLHATSLHAQTLHVETLHAQTLHVETLHVETLHVETLHATSLQFIPRGEIDIKGKGTMKTYFLEHP